MDELKKILRSLVISSPTSVTIQNLNKDFLDLEGENIPYTKHGHASLESLLRSIPDTLLVYGSGASALVACIKSEKSGHIQELVARQKKTNNSRPKTLNRQQNTNSRYRKKPGSSGSSSAPRQFIPTALPRKNPPIQVQNKAPYVNQSNAYVYTSANSPGYSGSNSYRSSVNYPGSRGGSQRRAANARIDSYKAQALTVSNASSNSSRHRNDSISSSNFSNEQKNSVPETSASKSALDIHKILPIKFSQMTKNIDKPKATESNFPPMKAICHDRENSMPRTSSVTSALESLKKLQTKYSEMTEINDEPKATKNIFESIEANYKKSHHESTNEDAVPDYAANLSVFRLDFPEYSVRYGEKIAPPKLPENIKCNDVIRLLISEVHNPFKFWFHIDTENNHLDLLMHKLDRFYTDLPADTFVIPSICLTPGQVCAVRYSNVWHRGEILSSVIDDKVKVLCVDYGLVSYVNIKDIKYLLTRYARLPAQAYRGCLSHIKPINLHWTIADTTFFLSLVYDVSLFAKISEIDKENRIFYMVLCNNTDESNPLQINAELMKQNYAVVAEEWQDSRIKQDGVRYHHLREDFPTFDMLEKGEYPTLMEIIDLSKKGIHFERITDNTLYSPVKIKMDNNASELARQLPFEMLATNPFRPDIMWEFLDLSPS